jgi:hypothetical protein
MTSRKFFQALTLTGFVFGFAGWIYIAENAVFHPVTLGLHLTHFANWPHEDTFGAMCFVVSSICFFVYNLIKDSPTNKK